MKKETAYGELKRRIEEDVEENLKIWSVESGMDTGFLILVDGSKGIFLCYFGENYPKMREKVKRFEMKPISLFRQP